MKTSTVQLLSKGVQTSNLTKKKKKVKSAKEFKPEPPAKKKKLTQEEKIERKARKERRAAKDESKALALVEKQKQESKDERKKMKAIAKKVKNLQGTFKDSVPRIHQLISEDNLPAAMANMSRSFLVMLTELIPILEKTVHEKPGQSSVYSLNALISQVREIQADLKADSDQGDLGMRIFERVILLNTTQVGQYIASSMYHLREQIRPLIKDGSQHAYDATYNKAMIALGTEIETMKSKMKEDIIRETLGE